MKSKYDKIIKEHYDKVATTQKMSNLSTMQDKKIRKIETDFILEEIKNIKKRNISILDVGCGNGSTLLKISKNYKKNNLYGFEQNKLLASLAKKQLKSKAMIFIKDIRKLESKKKFDLLICQRVLINILNLSDQKKALKNLINLVKKGGVLLFIETFNSGIKELNNVRKKFGLNCLGPSHHNKPLTENFFNNRKLKSILVTKNYELSSHYIVARVMHPFYLSFKKEKFKHNSGFVRFFSNLISIKNKHFSHIKLLKFIKN